jgi:hypothetical protein
VHPAWQVYVADFRQILLYSPYQAKATEGGSLLHRRNFACDARFEVGGEGPGEPADDVLNQARTIELSEDSGQFQVKATTMSASPDPASTTFQRAAPSAEDPSPESRPLPVIHLRVSLHPCRQLPVR